jgi:ribonuclease D
VDDAKEKLNGASWKRFGGRKDVNARELTVLAALCHSRDLIAEKLDRPPFKVIGDNLLLEIAKRMPEKDVDLADIGLSPRQIRLWGGEMLAAARRGAANPLVKLEQPKRPSDAVLRRVEKLKVWRKKVAQEIKVESDIVLPKLYLGLFCGESTKDPGRTRRSDEGFAEAIPVIRLANFRIIRRLKCKFIFMARRIR